jgi:hypothetical protein
VSRKRFPAFERGVMKLFSLAPLSGGMFCMILAENPDDRSD